ncbi:sulfite exporter TauE/SafE family protein [Methylosinus sp. Sm6]|uniref:urease accessory protein UreH domain-containing protein n=1 Tax=Methylosinus sp. Sm6 TaxID=2866948 RepID=UPI001C99306F|nr:sulfite exporter TauE/SafE family protein [Methylosinus sp. Sm6]MBY6240524.1 sulfite exporter TauE/SafE family protein [Methylosinus sp. Sm6]
MGAAKVGFRAHGMHCHGCERVIEAAARKLPGVRKVVADYPTEWVEVDYDPAAATPEQIRAAVERQGYRTLTREQSQRRRMLTKIAGFVIGVAGIGLLIYLDANWIGDSGAPDISRHMSLDLIFLLGLLTGFHCVGMCGGFVLSYTAEDAREGRPSLRSHLLYAAGKTLSYTTIGALFGLVGAIVAFTPLLRGAAGVAAGLFLIVFGLNMLGLFAPLRRIRLALPAPLQKLVARRAASSHRPFVIGLLNGLMIVCGPLQAMYVMAAGTGSALEGAKMLLAFGLGTLPVMLSFGALSTLVSASLTHRLLMASGAIVVALGAVMINRGLVLTGWGYDLQSMLGVLRGTGAPPAPPPAPAGAPQAARPAFQTIEMEVRATGFSPNRFTLVKDVPVHWVVDGKEITNCNRRIVAPSLKLEFEVKPGKQTIEFTPRETGVIRWSCWMGMLPGAFDVIDAPARAAPPKIAEAKAPDAKRGEVASDARSSAHDNHYRIVAGDTLRSIAKKRYGDAGRWKTIVDANPGLDPRRLRPGMEIVTPAKSE